MQKRALTARWLGSYTQPRIPAA